MAEHELTCIGCPLGCALRVETDDTGAVVRVTGNTCKRGEDYGRREVTCPTRTVTSTVRVTGLSRPPACLDPRATANLSAGMCSSV